MGHSIATNIFMLGLRLAAGLVPLSLEALLRAIELNGAAVADNLRAFHWGRRAAHDPAGVERPDSAKASRCARTPAVRQPRRTDRAAATTSPPTFRMPPTPGATRPWSHACARAEKAGAGDTALADAVARNYFKLLAYKDEYEVARLFAEPEFQRAGCQFRGRLPAQLPHRPCPGAAPPGTGAEPPKQGFGGWLLPAMKLLARFKFLRGTAFNPFGRSAERVQERELIADYERMLAHILDTLDTLEAPDAVRRDAAVALARLPETIRGYGPVRSPRRAPGKRNCWRPSTGGRDNGTYRPIGRRRS
jgi:indolepyruvate ferredoxin oxidoreductase